MKICKVMEPNRVEFFEVDYPTCKSNEVILKIKYFGICASDMQIFAGKHKYAAMPVTMGHEIAAEIVEVGSEVDAFKVGDKVTLEPQVSCGECYPCKTGKFNVCENLKVLGVHLDGCNAEYFATKPEYLHKVPNNLPDELVALVEPLAVGVGSIKRSKLFKGGNVVVVGAGTIGNLVAQSAKQLGAAKVLVADINDKALDFALECGIDFAVNTSKKPLDEAINEAFGIRKADVIIDCVAIPSVLNQIITLARPISEIVITGNYKEPVTIEMTKIQRNEIDIIGHMMYVREDFEDAIKLLDEGKIRTDKIITQITKFEDYPQTLEFVKNNPHKVTKALVKVNE